MPVPATGLSPMRINSPTTKLLTQMCISTFHTCLVMVELYLFESQKMQADKSKEIKIWRKICILKLHNLVYNDLNSFKKKLMKQNFPCDDFSYHPGGSHNINGFYPSEPDAQFDDCQAGVLS